MAKILEACGFCTLIIQYVLVIAVCSMMIRYKKRLPLSSYEMTNLERGHTSPYQILTDWKAMPFTDIRVVDGEGDCP